MNHEANFTESTCMGRFFEDNQILWPGLGLGLWSSWSQKAWQRRRLACTKGTATSSSWTSKKGGWWLREAINRNIPVVADISEFDGQKHTAGHSEGLVGPLRLAIQLGMVPRGKAHCSPQGSTECSPTPQGELVHCLGEAVHHCEDGGIAFRRREAHKKAIEM